MQEYFEAKKSNYEISPDSILPLISALDSPVDSIEAGLACAPPAGEG